jgi:HAD superfamily hydrolase (TIGR01490 family)
MIEGVEAAFFDLDKTILARSSGLALGRNFYRAGLISKSTFLRGITAQLIYLFVGADESKMERMREKALAVTKGWEKAKVQQIVEEVIGDVVQPIIYREALDLIKQHRADGHHVYIVSSSPEEVVSPIADLLQVDGAIGSRAQVDAAGRYTGQLEFYCYGEGKAEAVRQLAAKRRIELDQAYAYSDSITDLPLLEAVGHPVVTNPDRELRRIASDRGWEILRFSKPVTVRKRLAEIAPARTSLITAGAALSMVALAGYLWLRRRDSEERRPARLTLSGRR